MIEIPVTELAYLAGFFDGEGAVMLPKFNRPDRRNGFHLTVCVTNTHEGSLLRFVRWFVGHVRYRKPTRHNQRGYFTWTITTQVAERFLTTMLPYLVVKKPHAEIALDYRKTVLGAGRRGLSDNLVRAQTDFSSRLRVLNTKGKDVPLLYAEVQ